MHVGAPDEATLARLRQEFRDHRATLHTMQTADGERVEYLLWKAPNTGNMAIRYYSHRSCLMVAGDCGDGIYQWYSGEPIGVEWIGSHTSFEYFMGKCQASSSNTHYAKGTCWDQEYALESLIDYCLTSFFEGSGTGEAWHQTLVRILRDRRPGWFLPCFAHMEAGDREWHDPEEVANWCDKEWAEHGYGWENLAEWHPLFQRRDRPGSSGERVVQGLLRPFLLQAFGELEHQRPNPRGGEASSTDIPDPREYLGSEGEWHDYLTDYGYEMFGNEYWETTPSMGVRADWESVAHWLGLRLAIAQLHAEKQAPKE